MAWWCVLHCKMINGGLDGIHSVSKWNCDEGNGSRLPFVTGTEERTCSMSEPHSEMTLENVCGRTKGWEGRGEGIRTKRISDMGRR